MTKQLVFQEFVEYFFYQRADTYSTAGRDPRKIIRES